MLSIIGVANKELKKIKQLIKLISLYLYSYKDYIKIAICTK